MGAALAMAKGADSVKSAGRAEKPLLQDTRCWSLGHMAQLGEQVQKVRPGMGTMMGLTHHCKRVSERSLSRKESDLAMGTHELGPTEGSVRTWKG